MDLKKLQSFLAELYTKEEMRDRFFKNRSKVINRLNCSPTELEMLNNLSKKSVEDFSHCLLYKRFSRVKITLENRYIDHNDKQIFQAFNDYACNLPLRNGTLDNINDIIEFIDKELLKTKKNESSAHELCE
jgi:hypothetical protein